MTAFAAADAILHADPHLSVTAEWRRGGQGAPVDVRIIRTAASGLATPFGRQMRVTEGAEISVLDADGAPARNDTWTLADGTVLTATDVARSTEGTSWTVQVR